MKVLLLNPPFKTEYGRYCRSSRSPAIKKSGTLYYPLWLAYATGVLEDAGHEVKLIDACAYRYNRVTTYELVQKFYPDLIVVNTSTPSILNDIEIAAQLKRLLPESFVALVGTHPTALPEETLRHNSKVDAVARGEYDYTLKDLANALEEGKNLKEIKGISYREAAAIIHTPSRDNIENLDALPFVSKVYKKHLDVHRYFFSAAQYPMVMVITGRGCPFKCFFCLYPQVFHGRRYRLRSPENIVDEFAYIVRELPAVKEIGIEDDTFTANVQRVAKICRLLIDEGIHKKVSWWANVRADLDLETMDLMKKAGCRLLIAGFESGVQEILDRMHKNLRIEKSLQFVKNAKKAKLLIHGCFMVGNPGETKETMRKTLDFAMRLNVDTAQFFPMIAYPGTEAYEWARQNGFLRNVSYQQWLTKEGLYTTVIDGESLSAQDLVNFCDYARRRYYLRFRYILYKIRQCLSHYREARRTLISLKTFVKYLFRGGRAKGDFEQGTR